MKNVTVTLEEEVARWARVRAAERDTSLSRFLGDLLREQMAWEEAYGTAMLRYLSRTPQTLKGEGQSLPRREEIYEHRGQQPGLR